MTENGAPATYNPQKINWADPAYTITDNRKISNIDRLEVIPITPKANPILMYPSSVGMQSFIPCENVSSVRE